MLPPDCPDSEVLNTRPHIRVWLDDTDISVRTKKRPLPFDRSLMEDG